MSYRIDFRISCPQCFSYEQEPYHASIVILQSPDSPEPFFSYPGGCGGYHDCPTCNWCLKAIREMFIDGEINFYRNPQSIDSTSCQTLHQPIHPRSE